MSTELNTLILLHGFFNEDVLFSLTDKKEKFFVLEGRPKLESAQNTIDALLKLSVTPTLIADNMAGFLFYRNLVNEVFITFQEKNQEGILVPIGGLILAVMAKKHSVPVYAYPSSVKTELMGNKSSILSFNEESVGYQKAEGFVPLVEWVPMKYVTKINN